MNSLVKGKHNDALAGLIAGKSRLARTNLLKMKITVWRRTTTSVPLPASAYSPISSFSPATFSAALQCADQAIAHGAGIDLTWIALIRAHANMFLDQTEQAREFYLHFRTPENQPFSSWEPSSCKTLINCERPGIHIH